MNQLHFLGRVNDDNWAGYVGTHTYVLLSFGEQGRELLRQALRTLRARPEWQSIDLAEKKLRDTSARQVLGRDALASLGVERLCDEVDEADRPVPVPDGILKEVVLLTDEYDELEISKLLVFADSTVEVSVRLPEVLRGRSFLVTGGLELVDLPQPFRSVPATAAR